MTHHHCISESEARRPGRSALRIVGLAAAGVVLAVVFAFIFGFAVKLLWNWIMPAVFGLTVITFWQAFGLVLLAKILFGGHGHGFKHDHKKSRSPFERHFRDQFRKSGESAETGEESGPMPGDKESWHHFGAFWRDEGKNAFEAYLQGRGLR
ncbi:MAG: hypothetical protein JW843_01035 [Candidatus Aminicenantes bacterium]|nr:hypothetical protein [Candidatus Aminicenantes bacterium]